MSVHQSPSSILEQRGYTPAEIDLRRHYQEVALRINRKQITREDYVAAHKFIDKALGERDSHRVSIHFIQDVVTAYYRVSLADLISNRKESEIVEPRFVAQYLAKTLTLASYPAIGRQFNRDHTSVLSAVRKITRRIEHEPAFAERVERIRVKIEGKA